MPDRFFDQFVVGEIIPHRLHRTVTETDNLLITVLTHNPQPLHLDAVAAGQGEFRQILVNGIFTFGLMIGLSVGDTTMGSLIANLGYDQVVMPKPVFVGDTLRCETQVLETRASKSRPEAGIVVFQHQLFNQNGNLVCQCKRTVLLRRR